MEILNLTQGLTDNKEYKAWKFNGGELHFQLRKNVNVPSTNWEIRTRVNNSDDLILLILVIDSLKKDFHGKIQVYIPYFPYAQADRDFEMGECFSLKTIVSILNTLQVDKWIVFDIHSDVAPALLLHSERIDNSKFIQWVTKGMNVENTVILSPDAGAYKKIGKLSQTIGWKGSVAAANKYRNTSSGNIDSVELSVEDFGGKDVLIIDDICMGGRTFIGLAEKLRTKNVGKIFLAVSHMINLIINKELVDIFDMIYTTNSRHEKYMSIVPEFSQIAESPENLIIYDLFN